MTRKNITVKRKEIKMKMGRKKRRKRKNLKNQTM